jgi:hypothetical protein
VNANEHFLQDVVRVVFVAGDCERPPKNGGLILPDERCERRVVSSARLRDELGMLDHGKRKASHCLNRAWNSAERLLLSGWAGCFDDWNVTGRRSVHRAGWTTRPRRWRRERFGFGTPGLSEASYDQRVPWPFTRTSPVGIGLAGACELTKFARKQLDGDIADRFRMWAKRGPTRRPQNQNRHAPSAQILLILKILIRRDKDVEARSLGSFDERAVLEIVPAAFERRLNAMLAERPPKRRWRALVKQNFQGSGRNGQALARVRQHRVDLRACNPGKPLEKIRDRGTPFEVLEERADGNARATEQPLATDLSGDALNSGAQAPVEHIEVYSVHAEGKESTLPSDNTDVGPRRPTATAAHSPDSAAPREPRESPSPRR